MEVIQFLFSCAGYLLLLCVGATIAEYHIENAKKRAQPKRKQLNTQTNENRKKYRMAEASKHSSTQTMWQKLGMANKKEVYFFFACDYKIKAISIEFIIELESTNAWCWYFVHIAQSFLFFCLQFVCSLSLFAYSTKKNLKSGKNTNKFPGKKSS